MIRGPKGFTLEECPARAQHTRCPEGYIQWHSWADKKIKTHRQIRCRVCGLFAIWIPRKSRAKMGKAGSTHE